MSATGPTMAPMSDAPAPAAARRKPVTLYILVGLMVVKSILIILVLGGAYSFNDGPIGEALRMPGVGAAIREAPGAVGVLILSAAVLLVSALMLLAGQADRLAAGDGDHRHLRRRSTSSGSSRARAATSGCSSTS